MKKKKWTEKKTIVITIDMFKTDVVFFIGSTEKDIKKYLIKVAPNTYSDFNKEELSNWDNSEINEGRMIPFGGGFLVLLKPLSKKGFRYFVSVLTHEIIHVSHYLLREKRIPLTEETEEVYTYLADYLLLEVLNKLY